MISTAARWRWFLKAVLGLMALAAATPFFLVGLFYLYIGYEYTRFLVYRHVTLFDHHQQYAVQQLCGLVAPQARPLLSYWEPSQATDGYDYVVVFPLAAAAVAPTVAGGPDAALQGRDECRQTSVFVQTPGWEPSPAGEFTLPGAWYVGAGHPFAMDRLQPQSSIDVPHIARLLQSPGGYYRMPKPGKRHPEPFIFVSPREKLVVVSLWYWQGFPTW